MPIPRDLIQNILSDMKVELTEMFDRNFERKGFFGEKWTPRSSAYMKTKPRGSLLIFNSHMRNSIRPAIRGKGIHFTSPLPYTEAHNKGGTFSQSVRSHTRTNHKSGETYAVKAHSRTMIMPKRQFIGDSREVQQAVKTIINENLTDFFDQLANEIKQRQ